jgi:hypothetical protein
MKLLLHLPKNCSILIIHKEWDTYVESDIQTRVLKHFKNVQIPTAVSLPQTVLMFSMFYIYCNIWLLSKLSFIQISAHFCLCGRSKQEWRQGRKWIKPSFLLLLSCKTLKKLTFAYDSFILSCVFKVYVMMFWCTYTHWNVTLPFLFKSLQDVT